MTAIHTPTPKLSERQVNWLKPIPVPQRPFALHDLQLVNDLDLVQQNLKSGNIQGLQTVLFKLSRDGTDPADRAFAGDALEQGAFDAGYIARPAKDHYGNQGDDAA